MAGPQDYLTVKGPEGASYQLPKFDLGSQIAQIPTSYQEGQQYAVKRGLQTMFPDGNYPVDPATGQIDIGAIAKKAMAIGGPEAAAPYLNMMFDQQNSRDFANINPTGGGVPQPQSSQGTVRPAPNAPNAATGPDGIRGPRSGPVGSILPGGAQLTGEGGPVEDTGGQPQGGAGLGGQPAPFAGTRIPAGGWGAPAPVAFNDRVPPYGGMPNRPTDQQNAPPGPVGGGTVTQDGTTGQPAGPTSSREVAQNGPAAVDADPRWTEVNRFRQIAKQYSDVAARMTARPQLAAQAKDAADRAGKAADQRSEAIYKDYAVAAPIQAARQAGFGSDVPAYEGAQAGAKKIGEAQGGVIAGYIDKGQSAYKRMQLLDTVGEALKRGGGNITTGPFAEASLRAKQAISSMFGIDLAGVPEAEVAQKTGFGLATQAVKEITSRPTQMEVKMALQNNPGLLLSPKGSAMMIDVMKQAAQQDIDLSRLAAKPENQKNWPDVVDKYYAAHPLLSPFDHKTPLGMKDVQAIGGSTAQAIPDGATATHPGTGERMIRQGGKWIPLKAGPST